MKLALRRDLNSSAFVQKSRKKVSSERINRVYNSNLPTPSAPPASQPGLLFTTGDAGSWDEAGVGHPIVRYYIGDNEQRWFMWYTGRSTSCRDMDALFPSSGSMGLAVSSDGIEWARGSSKVKGERGEARAADIGCVLAPNDQDWWWLDTLHLHISDVQILSNTNVGTGAGVYWGFYSGGSFEESELPQSIQDITGIKESSMEGIKLRPGLAMSQDGRNWARIEAEHHTGALFDVGDDGEWDSLFIGSPQVIAAGPKDLRMYYYSFDQSIGKYVIGVATSENGFKWEKRGPIFSPPGENPNAFDALGATNRCVVRDIDTKQYFMLYEAVAADGKRSIGLAVSKDGLTNWKRYPRPILEASTDENGWDNGCVGTPWAVSMAQGRWRLYYAGRSASQGGGGAWQGLGLALSDKASTELSEGAPISFTRRQVQTSS